MEPGGSEKRPEMMGFERPMNALWLALLFAATWAFWSLRAALVLLALLVLATVVSFFLRSNRR